MDKESNIVLGVVCEKRREVFFFDNDVDNVLNLLVECYYYYYGSNLDMGRFIEVGFVEFFILFMYYLKYLVELWFKI